MTSVPNHALTPCELARLLIRPDSVAIYGASDDLSKMGARPVQFLKRAGYAGRIYPVNPKRKEIQGIKAWPDLRSLPETPDHVFILTPTDTVIDAVRQCAQRGVKLATILANGFSESGSAGMTREAQLRHLQRESGIRLIGPSSLGVVNPAIGLTLTANAAFAEPDLPPGELLVASHSGSLIGALVSRGKARGVGFAGLVSVGNEVDLSVGEICLTTLNDPAIKGYLLFLESLRHGAELRTFARAAHAAGKPVIVYKLGRSAAAAEMAVTHMGAIAGEDDIADAFCKDLGMARVGVLDALLETFPLAQRVPLDNAIKRVGVVTTTGGGAAMAVDQLGVRNVVVQPPSEQTLVRLAQAGLACAPGRVLDLTLAGTRYEVMKASLDILLTAPEFDLVLAVVGSSARFQPELAVQPIIESTAQQAKPLAAMLVPDAPAALATLTAAGIPCFRTPESCADAIAAVFARRTSGLSERRDAHPANVQTAPVPLNEAQSYDVLDQIGVAHATSVLHRFGSVLPELPFAFPVAVKVCSAEIPHKTEIGGVILGVPDRNALVEAIHTLQRRVRAQAAHARCDTVLIQAMQQGLGEALIGYRIDPEAGPLIVLAAGGIWAELTRDRSIRLAPVSKESAHAMIAELKAFRTLTGQRGHQRGDLDALAHAVSAFSQLALKPTLGIVEAELNPVLIQPQGQGVIAVDALMYRRGAEGGGLTQL